MYDPMTPIKEWQRWYRSHQMVGITDEPMTAKESREQMHDASNAVDALLTMENIKQKNTQFEDAVLCFEDTIAMYSSLLTGAELYKAMYTAAANNFAYVEKEYNKAKQLTNLFKGFENVC